MPDHPDHPSDLPAGDDQSWNPYLSQAVNNLPATPDPSLTAPGQQGYGYPPAWGHPVYAPAPRTNPTAVAALIAGIVGWTVLPLIASIAAVVLGHVARAQIHRTGEQGSGLALAGLILGYTATLVTGVVTIAAIVLFAATMRASVLG